MPTSASTKNHRPVLDLVRVQILFVDSDHASAVARALFEETQVDQFGEGVVAYWMVMLRAGWGNMPAG